MIPRRIVAIGTSAFFGVGDPLHGGFIGRLKQWHESKGDDNEFYNLGLSREKIGETTNEILERLVPESKVREPQLILLTSGINDIRRHGNPTAPSLTSLEQFETNIHDMIVKTKSVAKDCIFIGTSPIKDKHDRSDNYLLSEDAKTYALVVKKVCEEENVPYFDLYPLFPEETYEQFVTPDGVHPNEKAHEIIFEKLKEFLLKLYK